MPKVVVLLLLTLCGCGRIERTRQCQAVAQTVNAALDEIETQNKAADEPSTDGLRTMATRYTRLADDLEAMSISDKGLAKAVEDYISLARDAGQALEKMAGEDAGVVALQRAKGKASLAQVLRREKTIVTRIDAQCKSP